LRLIEWQSGQGYNPRVVDIRTQREPSPNASHAGDPRWLLVQRIVASPGFVNSQRLSAFLLYVTRQSLSGNADSLNERIIGETVFERSPDYDPRDDNIVRSHASRLRARLEDYFEGEGAAETLRLQIPRGSYAPFFEETTLLQPDLDAPPVNAKTSIAGDAPTNLRFTLIAGLILLAGIAVVAAVEYRARSAQQSPSHKLWSQMFRPGQETLIVPADSSLVVARLLSGNQVPLAAYAGGTTTRRPTAAGLVTRT
jgi:hypothetical protein